MNIIKNAGIFTATLSRYLNIEEVLFEKMDQHKIKLLIYAMIFICLSVKVCYEMLLPCILKYF